MHTRVLRATIERVLRVCQEGGNADVVLAQPVAAVEEELGEGHLSGVLRYAVECVLENDGQDETA
jgi:hypothetical protein